jgi:hypothetical protein
MCLKPTGTSKQVSPKVARDRVEQVRRREVAHGRPVPAAVFEQIVIEQHQDLVRVQKRALVVDDAQPVGVAVRRDADVAAVLQHVVLQLRERLFVRRGQAAAEQRVVPLVDHVHVAARRDEHRLQRRPRDAVHGVEHNLQMARADCVRAHSPQDGVQIGIHGVDQPDRPAAEPLGIRHGRGRAALQKLHAALQIPRHGFVGVPAALREDLDAVVDGGVVAGGDRHAVGQAVVFDGEHHERRGRLPVDEQADDSGSRQDLRRPLRRLAREKPAVIADHEAVLRRGLVLHLLRQRGREQLHVGLREAVRDDGPPAAGPEFYRHLKVPLPRP